ncbi:DUF6907 domain-containing protein [Ornithinimicrobium sp. W1679]|uniref:DUF6907 domain-containing protein n=1 Tax=Ornithinimicrobium sp. W1679 TaxID=3418770 RepID=UPI003CF2EC21
MGTDPIAPCPTWCVTAHDPSRGEDDWLHQGEPVALADGVNAVLCMSVDPTTGERDGPYVLIGDTQHTPEEAERLGMVLSALAQALPDPA